MSTADVLVILTCVIISLQLTLVMLGVMALRRGPRSRKRGGS
jgi:hypothetical protein